jgi:hypothetical protein
MAPRGRRKKAGLMREDAARDRMRGFGFHEHVISESIKELLEVYEDQWFLIEDDSYGPLLAICLEKQEEKEKQLAEVQANQLPENHNEEMAEEEQPNQLAVEIHEEEKVICFSSFSFSFCAGSQICCFHCWDSFCWHY